jgi:hypothetical protein
MSIFKRSRTLIILGLLGLVGIGGIYGYKAGLDYASTKMVDQVAKQVLTQDEMKNLLSDPEVKKLVEHEGGSPVDPEVPQQGAQAQQQPMFADKQEALKFLLSKYSISEVSGLVEKTSGGLTEEEKEEIKASLLSRLTTEEYQAIIITGLIEMKKDPNYANYFVD